MQNKGLMRRRMNDIIASAHEAKWLRSMEAASIDGIARMPDPAFKPQDG
jgi:hypothetical protein